MGGAAGMGGSVGGMASGGQGGEAQPLYAAPGGFGGTGSGTGGIPNPPYMAPFV